MLFITSGYVFTKSGVPNGTSSRIKTFSPKSSLYILSLFLSPTSLYVVSFPSYFLYRVLFWLLALSLVSSRHDFFPSSTIQQHSLQWGFCSLSTTVFACWVRCLVSSSGQRTPIFLWPLRICQFFLISSSARLPIPYSTHIRWCSRRCISAATRVLVPLLRSFSSLCLWGCLGSLFLHLDSFYAPQ